MKEAGLAQVAGYWRIIPRSRVQIRAAARLFHRYLFLSLSPKCGLVSTNIDQLIWFADLSGRANKNLYMGSGMCTSLERTPCDIDVLGSNPAELVSLTLVEIFQVTNNSSSEANLNHVQNVAA